MDVVGNRDRSDDVLLCDVSFYPSQSTRLQFVLCPTYVNGCRFSIQYKVKTRRRQPITLYLDIQLIFPCSQYINVESTFSVTVGSADPKHPETYHQEEKACMYSIRSHLCNFMIPLSTVEESTHIQCVVRTLSSKILPIEWQLSHTVNEIPAGIVNPGSTCYLNSIVQSFYNLIPFRSLVQSIDFVSCLENSVSYKETETILQSTLFALQKTFFALDHYRSPVDLSCLFQSFHWKEDDIYEQRDAHEMLLFLMNQLIDEWKSLPFSQHSRGNPIDALFKGEFLVSIGEKDGSFCSSKKEAFYAIPLNVETNSNLEEAFHHFFQREELDSNNRIQREDGKLVEGWKEVSISGFPEILIIQLKRFSFDSVFYEVKKIDQFFSFPETLTLSSPNETVSYALKSVLVHSGTPLFGHYFAFCQQNEQWIRLEDDRVFIVSADEMKQSSFGVSSDGTSACKVVSKKSESDVSSAYLLFYSRESGIPIITQDNEFLRNLILYSMNTTVQKYYDSHGITIRAVTLELLNQAEVSKYSLLWDFVTPSSYISFHLWNSQTLLDLIPQLEKAGIPTDSQNWFWMKRRNSLWRLADHVTLLDMKLSAEKLCDSRGNEVMVYISKEDRKGRDFLLLFIGTFRNGSCVWRELWIQKEETVETLIHQLGSFTDIWWRENHQWYNVLKGVSLGVSLENLGLENGDILFVDYPKEPLILTQLFMHPYSVFCFPLSKYSANGSFILSINGTDQIQTLKQLITNSLQNSSFQSNKGTGDYRYIPAVPQSFQDIRIFRFAKTTDDENQDYLWKSDMRYLMTKNSRFLNDYIVSTVLSKQGNGETFDWQCGNEVEDEEMAEIALIWKPALLNSTSDLFLYYDVIPQRNPDAEILYVNVISSHDYQEMIVQLIDDCTCESILKEIQKYPNWSDKQFYCYNIENGYITHFHAITDIVRYGCVVQHRSHLCVCEKIGRKNGEIECEIAVLKGWFYETPEYSRDHIPRILPVDVSGTYQHVLDQLLEVFGGKNGDLYYLENSEKRIARKRYWLQIPQLNERVRDNPCNEAWFGTQDGDCCDDANYANDHPNRPLFAVLFHSLVVC